MSSFVGGPPHVPSPMAARGLYSPDVVQAYPRIGLSDWLYYKLTGLPLARPYITPHENLYLQQLYMGYMGSPLNVASWGMQFAAFPLSFVNPLLGVGVGLGGYALGQFASRYIYRFDEVERTRQVLGVHFQNWTRMGYKGMDVAEAAKANLAIIEASLESATFGISEMRDIAAKIAQTNLLAGLRTVDDFKQRFKQLVGVLREITGALHITYDEAIQLVSERVANGMTPEQVATFSYQVRNVAAAAGVNPAAVARNVEGTAQSLTQYGLTMTAGSQLAQFGYTVLGAAKNVLPASVYKQLNLEGKQEPISQALTELTSRLIGTDTSFQMAVLGAQYLGGTPMALEGVSFLDLLKAGALAGSRNPALFRREGRMIELSRILEQNPSLTFQVLKAYMQYMATPRLGVDKETAMKETLMNMGVSNPEYAGAIAKLLEQLPAGAAQLFGQALSSQANIEQERDKLIQQAQDQMASFWKQLWTNIAFWNANWPLWRSIHLARTEEAARRGEMLFYEKYGWAYNQPGLYGQFFSASLGKAGAEAFFGPEGFKPVTNAEAYVQTAGLKTIKPEEFVASVAHMFGTTPDKLYAGLAANVAYSIYAVPQYSELKSMTPEQREQLQMLAGFGQAARLYFTEEDRKKLEEKKKELSERKEPLEIELAPGKFLQIDPKQWDKFSDDLKDAIASALVAFGFKQEGMINRIAAVLNKNQTSPEMSGILSKVFLAYGSQFKEDKQKAEFTKKFQAWISEAGKEAYDKEISEALSKIKDEKLKQTILTGLAANNPAAFIEAAKAGLSPWVTAKLAYKLTTGQNIDLLLASGVGGVSALGQYVIPMELIKAGPDVLKQWQAIARDTSNVVNIKQSQWANPSSDVRKKANELWEMVNKDKTFTNQLAQIRKLAKTFYTEARAEAIDLSEEDIAKLIFFWSIGDLLEGNTLANADAILAELKRNPQKLVGNLPLTSKEHLKVSATMSTSSPAYGMNLTSPKTTAFPEFYYYMFWEAANKNKGLMEAINTGSFSLPGKLTSAAAASYQVLGLSLDKISNTQQKKAIEELSTLIANTTKDSALTFEELKNIYDTIMSNSKYQQYFKTYLEKTIGATATSQIFTQDKAHLSEYVWSFVSSVASSLLTGTSVSTTLPDLFKDIYKKNTQKILEIGPTYLKDIGAVLDVNEKFANLGSTTNEVNKSLKDFGQKLQEANRQMDLFNTKFKDQSAPGAPYRAKDVANNVSGKRSS
jgi:uncharacterized coiled-coil protein SlyX